VQDRVVPSRLEADSRHAQVYAQRLRAYGETFMNSAPPGLVDDFHREWLNIDEAFCWASAEAENSNNLEAAQICVGFVSKASLWPLNMWRPAIEIYDWLQKGRRAAEQVGDTTALAGILNNIGILQVNMGKPREALGFHEEARRLAEQHGHDLEAAHSASSIGICYRHLGERDKALDAHRAALKIAEKSEELEHLCLNCHGNIAIVLAEMGNTTAAIRGFETALDLARKLNRRREEGYALVNLGRAYAEMGALARAEGLLRQGLDIAREV
jgi:tetratricopeptide (TPR) repeat protein